MLILCEASICYLSDINADIISKPLDQPTQFVAWTSVDGQRWLLADMYGKLYFLMLNLDENERVEDWNIDLIGQTSEATRLVYLDAGTVFVGSHCGDSHIYKILQKDIELVQTLVQNIAPILDFTIMDMGNRSGDGKVNEYSSGQARIVTGSGGFIDGSLRSVRSGVGLEELGTLPDLNYSTEVFAIKSKPSSQIDDTLVVSFVSETRVFQFQTNGEIEEQTTLKSFNLTEATILASTLANGYLLQVVASAAVLIDIEDDMVLCTWIPPNTQSITAASAGDGSLLLSVGGVEAVVLDTNQLKPKARRGFPDKGQIACIHVTPLKDISVAGFWGSATIFVLNTTTLETVEQIAVSDDALSVPRSLLLAYVLADQDPTLFIGMANGEVVTFSLNPKTFKLASKKVTMLGSQPANFKSLPSDGGLSNVFATCEHPSLIYGSERRLVFSAVNADKATSVCSFDSELYPDAIAIATPEDVKIAQVGTERTTNVNSLPVGLLVRRIAYTPNHQAFGLGTIERSSIGGTTEVVKSHFKLADEVLFEILDTYPLNEEELVESVMRADIRVDESGQLVERFVVGTAFLEEDGLNDPDLRGRILVFGVTFERKLKLITELNTRAACRELSCVNGYIVAALIKTVWCSLCCF